MEQTTTLLPATNGKFYKLTEGGKVKAVANKHLRKFTPNETKYRMDEMVEVENTKVLFTFLKKFFPQAVFKYKSVYVDGLRILYFSHGFQVIDTWNYNEKKNVNKFNNDLATPESVVEYLKGNLKRPVLPPKEDREDAKVISQLAEKFGVKKVRIDKSKIKKLKEKEAEQKKKVTKDKAKSKKVAKVEKEKIAKRVKMFKGLAEEYPYYDIQINKGNVIYKLKGPSGKFYEKKTTVHQFLVNYCLTYAPRSLAYLTKVAKGEKFEIYSFRSMTKLLLDPTVPYEPSVFAKTEHVDNLIEACREVMYVNALRDPLHFIFGSKLKRGDKVIVYSDYYGTSEECSVHSTETGLKLLFSDGNIDYLDNRLKYRIKNEVNRKNNKA